jgi:hypothetical protein
MVEERYHVITQSRFYPEMSNVNKNISVETKLSDYLSNNNNNNYYYYYYYYV